MSHAAPPQDWFRYAAIGAGTEDAWTPPSAWQPNPRHWHSDDAQATEHEVSELVGAFARALQPEIAVETGSNSGQTAEAIGRALARNGHGHLYSLETDPVMADMAEARCAGLPVTVVRGDSLSWTPPGEVGLAWLDSETGIRHLELQRLRRFLAEGAIVGIHDTGPQHVTARFLLPLVQSGVFTAITLRTPRGVTFGTVARDEAKRA
ncbi:MAG TPA: class I SAM-dependent methyltransferase [Trebonia sp.]